MPSVRTVSNIKANLLRPATTSHFEVEIPIIGALSKWENEAGGQAQINFSLSITHPLTLKSRIPSHRYRYFKMRSSRWS